MKCGLREQLFPCYDLIYFHTKTQMNRQEASINAKFENFRQIYKVFTEEKREGEYLKYCLFVTALILCYVSEEPNASAFHLEF